MDTDTTPTPRIDEGREEIIFGGPLDQTDTVVYFGPERDGTVDPDTLQTLLEENYIDPEDRQNNGPSAQEAADLGVEVESRGGHLEYTGYVVPPHRDDARITITGFEATNLPPKYHLQILNRFWVADSVHSDADTGALSVWYD